jgi:3alpha(or 20beta)-hydroxysteroid dehydrogenase
MKSLFAVDGKVILITGAARGIGATCAQILAAAGAKVMLTDILTERGIQTTDEMCKNGGTAEFLSLDVTSESAWERTIEATIKSFGGLDVLLNNAGIEIIKPLFMTSLDEFKTLQAVNVEGVFLGTKMAVTAMMPGGAAGQGGSIINMSSIAGLVGAAGFSSYCASKGAVRMFSKGAAVEYGPMNIRVNSVHPGFIQTAMADVAVQTVAQLGFEGDIEQAKGFIIGKTPLGHFGETEDIAAAIQFLASDASRFITGTELVVDGGYTIN